MKGAPKGVVTPCVRLCLKRGPEKALVYVRGEGFWTIKVSSMDKGNHSVPWESQGHLLLGESVTGDDL